MKDAGKTKAQLMSELEELRQRIAESEILDTELKRTEERLVKISDCFLNFGTVPPENINRLTALCGELLGATCALYNRLDRGLLYSWGQWNVPPDYNPVDKPDGHICYDVIKKAGEKVLVVSNLPETHYAQTDPNVIPYKLQTYVGRAVKFGNAYVGSLCVVYQDDFVPSEGDKMIMGIIASAIGVEEKRKQAEEELRESREFNRSVLMSLKDHIAILDREGNILDVNESWVRFARENDAKTLERIGFGANYLEVCRKSADMGEEIAQAALKGIHSVIDGSRQWFEMEYPCDSPTEKRWFHMTVVPFRALKGGVIVAHSDITEQKAVETESRRLRAELAHRDRVVSIGALTGAIAHEINQPLAAILSNAQAALRFLSDERPDLVEVREALQDIVSDDKRAGKVIRRLRGMLKKEETRREIFDLNEVIADVVHLISSEIILRNATLTEDLTTVLPPVVGDPVQIQQVVLNVLLNALDAVNDQPLDTRTVEISTRPDGDEWVVVCVRDTGPGITTEPLEAIFDPFYTTKSHGVGIGLAICRSIVEVHGGRVWAEKSPEGGAQVSFRLPIK